MGQGGRSGSKRNGKKCARNKKIDSDDSDEDYLVEEDEDEINAQSDEPESLVGDDSEEESFSNFEEEEEEADEDEEEEEVKRAVKAKVREGSLGLKENGIKRSTKRKRIACNEEEEDEDYEEEEEEEEEEEFTPDEVDSLDEEEEIPFPKDNKKRNRPPPKKKGTVKSRRRKRGAKVVRKALKRKRGSSLGKAYSSNSGFRGNVTTLKGKTKNKPLQRKKILVTNSDSDFVSSESSDFEYTISEDEREQVREASEICRSLNTNLRSSKRIEKDEALRHPRKPRGRKGKEKAEDVKNGGGKQVCGICLTEEGKNTVRGTLNCCSHYFCFACIMEWSKVETRCPLCKQRFATISKPARCVTGVDLRNAVIQVPERDQVYQPSEEELRNYLDPYENVICTECHQGGDDALMLLCDLCDSPAHTYCVGLGRVVPEGNWYCEGCQPALGPSHSQAMEFTPDQRTSTNLSDGPSTFENMADIDLNVAIPETPLTQGNGFVSSPRYPGGNLQASSPVSGVGVSTVSGRRRIHRQIQYLLSSNRMSHMAARVDRGLPSNLRVNFSGFQIDGDTGSTYRQTGAPEGGTFQQTSLSTNRMRQMAARVDRGSASDSRVSVMDSQIDRGSESTCEQTRAPEAGTSQHTSCTDRLQNDPSCSVQRRDLLPGRLSHTRGRVVQVPTSVDGSARSSVQWVRFHGINMGLDQALGCERQLQPCTGRSSIGSNTNASLYNRDGEDASLVKQQLQSMVKSHLKSLSVDMDLGYNTFKEIARSSTHTILAACGLEHRKGEVYEVQPPVCLHGEGLANGLSSLMKGCCPSCFDSFVKDVVRTIMDIRVPQWLGFRNF